MKHILLILLCSQSYLINGQLAISMHDASSMGRGGGFVTDYSAGSVFDNPAGLSSISGAHLLGNFTWFETFPGVHGGALGFAMGVKEWELGIDVQAVGDEVFKSQHIGMSMSHSIGSTSIGAKFKWILLGIESLGTIHRAGLDIGAISSIGEKVRLGVFVSNINSPLLAVTYREYLVLKMSFGIYYQLADNASLNIDLYKAVDQVHRYSVGLDYQALNWASLVLGVSGYPISIHFGLKLGKGTRSIAYGMGAQNGFGNNHTWTLDYGF